MSSFLKGGAVMVWAYKAAPKTVRVTKKLADEFANMEAAHTDRPLSERRLGVYRKVLDTGGFRPVTWAKAWCEETGQYYRVNGKHTSTLFSSVDSASLDGLYAVVEEYKCDTLEDVAKLYSTFDSQTQTRTAADINASFASVIPELAAFDVRTVSMLVGALNFNPSQARGAKLTTPAERAEVLFDNIDFCVWFQTHFAHQRDSAHIRRIPVVAAVWATWRKAKADAERFWLAVRDATGDKPDVPDRKLNKFLEQTRALHGGGSRSTVRRFLIQPKEYYAKSIHAWNAWRKGERSDLKYFADAKVPEAK